MRHKLGVRVAYPVLNLAMRLLFLLLGPVQSHGRGRVPRRGGLLILSNHLADVDPIVIQLGCPRMIHFMAKSELFDIPVLRTLIKWYHAFPVKRGEPDRGAIKHAIELVSAGEAVCIFPEGQLSETGELQPLLPGAALIVRKAGVPVVCCGLQNTNKVMPYRRLFPRPALCRTHVRWGQARTFENGATNDEIVSWATEELTRLTTTR